MTFLEKVMEKENDTNIRFELIDNFCPSDYELENPRKCKNDEFDYEKCRDCWEREMPNTEPKNELVRDFNCELDMAYEKGLNDGRNEVWEFVKKWCEMEIGVAKEVFGFEYDDIFKNLAPQEALAKLKAYEEAQIEVGDVVELPNGRKGVATFVLDEEYLYVMDENGLLFNNYKFGVCKKTGRKVDIKSFLEQIGE